MESGTSRIKTAPISTDKVKWSRYPNLQHFVYGQQPIPRVLIEFDLLNHLAATQAVNGRKTRHGKKGAAILSPENRERQCSLERSSLLESGQWPSKSAIIG